MGVVNPLSLEHPEKPFAGDIVAKLANCAHAAHQAVAAEENLKILTCIS